MTDTPAIPAAPVPTVTPAANVKPATPAVAQTPAQDTLADITVGADGMVPLKINGVEKRVPLKEAIALAQKADAADQRFKSAADIERTTKQQQAAMKEFIDTLKKDPRKVLSDPRLGVDLRAFAETYLGEQIQREMQEAAMTPEQKEMAKMKKQLEEYEAEKKKVQETEREAAKKVEEAKMIEQVTNEIKEALGKAKIHRDQKYAVGRMAYYMDYARKNSIPLTWDQAAVQVKKDVTEGLRDYGKAYESDEELAESLGEDMIKRLNQYMINKTKGNFGMKSQTNPTQPKAETKPKKSSKKMNYDQFRESLNEKFGTDLA